MGLKNFTLSEDQRKEYASGILLDLMQQEGKPFSVLLEGDDKYLEPLLGYMMAREYIEVDSSNNYAALPKGLEKLENLKARYEEYLSHFDIFCAVDLEAGEFAFEKIFELEDEAWDAHINEERFVDLRISVAWFKGINPSDLVFLSFLKEGLFDTTNDSWQFDLLSGLIWEQIEEIVDSAIMIEELGYVSEEGEIISGEQVLGDVIAQGAKLNAELHAEEDNLSQEDHHLPNDYADDQTFVTTYESYYDPFYISPIWFLF